MTTLIQVLHLDDFYEILIRGSLIISIKKYLGGTAHCREMAFDDLCEQVQEKIVKKIEELYE